MAPAYCRKCGYRIDKGRDPQCPECGRGYDLANSNTFNRTPHGHRLIPIILIYGSILILLWVTSYLILASPNPDQLVDRHPGKLDWVHSDVVYYDHEVQYRIPGKLIRVIYAPLNEADRVVRRQYWQTSHLTIDPSEQLEGATLDPGEETGEDPVRDSFPSAPVQRLD